MRTEFWWLNIVERSLSRP